MLILPEYIIEFQYDTVAGSALAAPAPPRAALSLPVPAETLTSSVLQGLDADLRMLARPLVPWLASRHDAAAAMGTASADVWAAEVRGRTAVCRSVCREVFHLVQFV